MGLSQSTLTPGLKDITVTVNRQPPSNVVTGQFTPRVTVLSELKTLFGFPPPPPPARWCCAMARCPLLVAATLEEEEEEEPAKSVVTSPPHPPPAPPPPPHAPTRSSKSSLA
jgi:hypothetical protein